MNYLNILIAQHRMAYIRFVAAIDADWTSAEHDAAMMAEDIAAIALLAHPCVSLEEVKAKATYIASAPSLGNDMEPHYLAAFISSLTLEAVA